MTTNIQRMHGLIEQLAGRFKGYLPWPEEKRDATVRGHEMFIEDTIKKADALVTESETARISAGGSHELRLFGTPGITGTVAGGLTVHMDPTIPDGTIIVRDGLGRELGRIINVG